jgi:hypothetical protein
MTNQKKMTNQELMEAAKKYDRNMLEGGGGFNPYRVELEDRYAARPKERTEYTILKEIEAIDCAIARESGTFDQAKVDALRKELDELRKKESDKFTDEWTKAVTAQRREKWNNFVRSMGQKIDERKMAEFRRQNGWGMDELKKAVAIYK